MYFDRFDICAAYYFFGADYHGGMGTKEYKYLGRALKCGFQPGPMFSRLTLSENAEEIYLGLETRLQCEIENRYQHFSEIDDCAYEFGDE